MSLPHGLARHPGRTATAVHQPFGHQGLLFESEIGSYSSRNEERTRVYSASTRRHMQPYYVGPRYIYSMTKRYQHGMNLYATDTIATSSDDNPEPPCDCNYVDSSTTERFLWLHQDGPIFCRSDASHRETHRCYNTVKFLPPGICAPSTHYCFPRAGDPLGTGDNANPIDMGETHRDCVGYYYQGWGGGCAFDVECYCDHLKVDYYGPMPDVGEWTCTSCPAKVCPLP